MSISRYPLAAINCFSACNVSHPTEWKRNSNRKFPKKYYTQPSRWAWYLLKDVVDGWCRSCPSNARLLLNGSRLQIKTSIITVHSRIEPRTWTPNMIIFHQKRLSLTSSFVPRFNSEPMDVMFIPTEWSAARSINYDRGNRLVHTEPITFSTFYYHQNSNTKTYRMICYPDVWRG